MGMSDELRRTAKLPIVEYHRLENTKKQIRVLTYQPGEPKPFETIVDVVPLRRRARVRRSTSRGE